MTLHLTLYLRQNDPASEEARQWSRALQTDFPHEEEIRDVDTNPAWKEAAGENIPTAEVDGRRLPAPLTRADLASALAVSRAIGEYRQEQRVPEAAGAAGRRIDRIAGWLSRHWLSVFNGFIVFYLGLAFLAPVLMKVGAEQPASTIYNIYLYTCHELGFRSFYLFGEKPVHPRDVFLADTGVDPNDLWASRLFRGNEQLGYKVALCERDVAIYGSLLLAGIAFHFVRRKLKPLHWALWVLLGILPMGIDGGSQLLSYLPFLNFPVRESTVFLRVLTGSLFGIMSVWFAYPYVEDSMVEGAKTPPPGTP
jgi:uncharacterized membrane protein